MSFTALATRAVERTPLPDVVTRAGVGFLVARARRKLAAERPAMRAFAHSMSQRAIAENTAEANEQHYELPAGFFELVLGPRLKYSSCLYRTGTESLAEAEEAALAETCLHAELADGQQILELGCGWGSLSLWMAEHYPRARIVSVSNSHSQRRFIAAAAERRGLTNLKVVTCDMNVFTPDGCFDRIVSVEMFEHMANWRALLERLVPALADEGRMFLHVFSHRNHPYRFESDDPDDFIARHFFTGGIMPSHQLIDAFDDLVKLDASWRWSGAHYQRTALQWLARFDAHADEVAAIFRDTYGPDADLWVRRWRLFFLSVAGLFGDQGGEVWGVSHWRLAAR